MNHYSQAFGGCNFCNHFSFLRAHQRVEKCSRQMCDKLRCFHDDCLWILTPQLQGDEHAGQRRSSLRIFEHKFDDIRCLVDIKVA